MSKFGFEAKKDIHTRVHEETVVHQHVPGRAINVNNPSVKLIHTIGGGFFNEPKYYDSNRSEGAFLKELFEKGKISSKIVNKMGLSEQACEVLETAHAIAEGKDGAEPEDLLIIAAWARDPEHGLKLRTTPQILLALAAASTKAKPFVRKYATAIMQRPDEIRQVFAAFRHLFQKPKDSTRHKGSLPHSLRKGLGEALANSSLYSILKYSSEGDRPTMVDVLMMISGSKKLPRRKTKEGEVAKDGWPLSKSVFEYLVNGKVTEDAPAMIKARDAFFKLEKLEDFTLELQESAGLTWENITSKFGTSKEVWELCIPMMGEMALTRNLRNFEQAGISKEAWDAVYKKLGSTKDTRQLPFRFFTAFKHTTSVAAKTAAAMQLDNAVMNVPDLPGVTVVLVDNSGSAVGCAVSGKSELRVSDAGNMLAAIAAKRFGRRTMVGVFGDSAIWVPFNPLDSCITIKEKIDSVAQKEERSQYGAMGMDHTHYGSFTKGSGVGAGTETGLWFAIDDLTKREVHVDRMILLSDLCCYTLGDNNCGFDMSQYFGKSGNRATVQSMIDLYRQKVNKDVQVYSVNLNGHAQSQLREGGDKSHLMSGWSEQIFSIMGDVEKQEQRAAEPVEIPTLAVLRDRYRRPVEAQNQA